MKTKYIIAGFIVTALAQLFVPFAMAYEQEDAYTNGNEYRFKTAPVDPNDPFRGKYVSLDFNMDIPNIKKGTYDSDEQLYAVITTGDDGFAAITKLQREQPAGDYILVKAGINYDGTQHIKPPFDRFYMEESKAPDAEKAYNRQARQGDIPAYAVVAVKGDVAVIKDVILNGMPIRDYVIKHREDPGSN